MLTEKNEFIMGKTPSLRANILGLREKITKL
jgi:hypothetical protein